MKTERKEINFQCYEHNNPNSIHRHHIGVAAEIIQRGAFTPVICSNYLHGS